MLGDAQTNFLTFPCTCERSTEGETGFWVANQKLFENHKVNIVSFAATDLRYSNHFYNMFLNSAVILYVFQSLHHRYAVPPPPDQRPLRHGLHPGLHRLPRAGDDQQGVHAVRHLGGRLLAGRARAHVLLGEGVVEVARREPPTGQGESVADGGGDVGGQSGAAEGEEAEGGGAQLREEEDHDLHAGQDELCLHAQTETGTIRTVIVSLFPHFVLYILLYWVILIIKNASFMFAI